jgi:hypothetical protein
MRKYFILFFLSIIIFFYHASVTKHAIYGDGNGYYSYTQSLFFDKSLNFDPIYKHLGNFPGTKFIFSRIFWNTDFAKNGVIRQNPYLIGTGIVWLPSMAVISVLNYILNLGVGRFSLIYELGPGITGILLIISGLYFLEKYLLNFFHPRPVFWTILTVFFASNVFYFTAFEPALSHQPSFFLVSFLLYWTYKFKPSPKNIFLFGILTGFLAMIRIADTILLIPIFFQIWQSRPKLKFLSIYLLGALISISPQLLMQNLMYGNVLSNPYLTGQSGIWQFNLLHLFEYLFSPKRGLFLWSPILLVGIWGLIKSKSFLIIITILFLWLITSSWSAYLSAGFGQRFSFSAIPYMAFGLAYIFRSFSVKKLIIFALPFILWNFVLLANFYLHKDRLVVADDLTFKEFIVLQIKTPLELATKLSLK